jgi:hypothetical protein
MMLGFERWFHGFLERMAGGSSELTGCIIRRGVPLLVACRRTIIIRAGYLLISFGKGTASAVPPGANNHAGWPMLSLCTKGGCPSFSRSLREGGALEAVCRERVFSSCHIPFSRSPHGGGWSVRPPVDRCE